jgi:hypothetical protein
MQNILVQTNLIYSDDFADGNNPKLEGRMFIDHLLRRKNFGMDNCFDICKDQRDVGL